MLKVRILPALKHSFFFDSLVRRPGMLGLAMLSFCVVVLPANGQFIRARSYLEKIRSLSNDVQPDKEESRLQSTAKDIIDQANSMASALESVGETLARASGPFESERSEIGRAAAYLRKGAQEVAKDAQALINLFGEKSRWP